MNWDRASQTSRLTTDQNISYDNSQYQMKLCEQNVEFDGSRSLKSDIIAVKFDWWEVVAKIMSREIKKNENYISKNSANFFHTSIKLERVWDDVKSFIYRNLDLKTPKI